MPPFSKNLAEEGVLIRNFKLVARTVAFAATTNCETLLLTRAVSQPRVDDNLADVRRRWRANQQGVSDLARQ